MRLKNKTLKFNIRESKSDMKVGITNIIVQILMYWDKVFLKNGKVERFGL